MNNKLNPLVLAAILAVSAFTANASIDNKASSPQASSAVTTKKSYNGFYGYSRSQAEQKFLAWANGRNANYYCRTTYPGEMSPSMWLCTGYVD